MELSEDQTERYARHLVLQEIGETGQKKLINSKVLVIGAGGLGSAAIMYLAAAGVGTIGIVDYDKVSLSNLQRQIIHNNSDKNLNKTSSAAKKVHALNPDVKTIIFNEHLTPDNIMDIIRDFEFIIDCTDRFETKFLINDACVLAEKPYSHAGVIRFEGQAMTYVPKKGPCLRCMIGDVPHNSPVCSEVGVLGAVVGVLGSIQALEAIKYIVGTGELMCGRVFSFNGLSMQTRLHRISGSNPECKICGVKPTIINLNGNRKDYDISC